MELVEHSIEVAVPVHTAYNQWTQFEDFPEFMEGVEEVRQLDERRLHWVAQIAGKREEWDAEIVEQIPDQVIAWRSTSGARTDGEVLFDKAQDNLTKVTVRMRYDTEGTLEKIGSALGLASARVHGDLSRFKDFIESRQHETGAWRGEIHGQKVSRPEDIEARSKRLRDMGTPSTTPGGASGKM